MDKIQLHLFKLFNRQVVVPINNCITFTGFSFSKNEGWHHIIATLEEYVRKGLMQSSDSIFTRFHNNYQIAHI